MAHANLAEMFFSSCEKFSDNTAMMYKEDETYQQIKYGDIKNNVTDIAGGLASLGIKRDEKIIVLAENSKEWAFCDYAILSNGAVTVPVYSTLFGKDVAYLINDCDAQVVIVSDANQLNKVLGVKDDLGKVDKIIVINPQGINTDGVITLHSLSELGREFNRKNPDYLRKSIDQINRDDLATIIYTSGTTGEPKGVMLTHGNLLSNMESALRVFPLNQDDVLLSFLPLSHSFERMVGHFCPVFVGAAIAYAESIDKVPDNLREVKPTILASVPRLFEKIYAKVLAGVESGSPLKQRIFFWSVGVGKKVVKCQQKNLSIPLLLGLYHKIAVKLVFSKLCERVGGNLRFFCSGGAPLSPEIGEFFTAAGLQVLEGYGLTETSPIISVNRPDKFQFGTVGIKLDNVEVKIASDGEILTRGPHVMKGYYKKEAATREAIDEDGWFHTGDIGVIDEDGFLKITDRKKNIIVTAAGKNIAPQKMENLLIMLSYVEQSLVIGDRRKFCSALIVPAFEELKKFAKKNQIVFNSNKELCENPQVIQLIQNGVEKTNDDCASYETIKKFILVDHLFSIESGELTPSLKIKRKVVEANYKEQIDALYS